MKTTHFVWGLEVFAMSFRVVGHIHGFAGLMRGGRRHVLTINFCMIYFSPVGIAPIFLFLGRFRDTQFRAMVALPRTATVVALLRDVRFLSLGSSCNFHAKASPKTAYLPFKA